MLKISQFHTNQWDTQLAEILVYARCPFCPLPLRNDLFQNAPSHFSSRYLWPFLSRRKLDVRRETVHSGRDLLLWSPPRSPQFWSPNTTNLVLQLCPRPEVIWSSCNFENAHAHSQTHTCSECKTLFGLAHNLKMHRCKERAYNCVQCNKFISLLVKLQVWKRIWSSTVEWWATLAQNVRSHLVKQDIWRRTW